MERALTLASDLVGAVSSTVRGKPEAVRLSIVTLLAGGHLLIEDLPGSGKTLLAKSLAVAIGGRFGRVQCTPDLLPTDITGTSVFQPATAEWTFRPGPLFANVLLLDEVNRASPRTQAALLEPMEEHQVTVDGATRPLPAPFFCVATQNPFGQVGTFPLPESQLDRFALVLRMGWPDRGAEREILTGQGGSEILPDLEPVTTPTAVNEAIATVRRVQVTPALVEYVLDLAEATRRHTALSVGASPRAALGLLHAAQAHAVVAGRTYATPDDVQAVAVASFAHRVLLGDGADTGAATPVLHDLIDRVAVPRP